VGHRTRKNVAESIILRFGTVTSHQATLPHDSSFLSPRETRGIAILSLIKACALSLFCKLHRRFYTSLPFDLSATSKRIFLFNASILLYAQRIRKWRFILLSKDRLCALCIHRLIESFELSDFIRYGTVSRITNFNCNITKYIIITFHYNNRNGFASCVCA